MRVVASDVRAAVAAGAETPFLSGADHRWAVAVDDTAVANGVDTTAIAALADGASIAHAARLAREVLALIAEAQRQPSP